MDPIHAGRGRRDAIIAAAIALVAVTAIAVTAVVAITRSRAGAAEPRDADRPVAPGLLSMTLTADEVNAIMGTSDIAPKAAFGRLAEDKLDVQPADCRTVFTPALYENYAGTNYLAVLGRDYQEPSVRYFWLRMAVFAMPSPDTARGFLGESAQWWQACRGAPFKYSADPATWSIQDLSVDDDKLVTAFHAEGTVTNCQRALARVEAFVIDIGVCTDRRTRGADLMASKLMAKAGS
jgi:serine/threonine-protein kinase